MTHTAAPKTHKVADLTWDIVAERLASGAAALLPIGAGAKQHGLHMTMATDQVSAEYFATVVADRRADLADADLRRLSRLRRLCRERGPVRCGLPSGREGDRRCAARLRRRTRAVP